MANIRNLTRLLPFFFIASLFLVSLPTVQATTETRYFRFDVDYGEMFETSQGTTYSYLIGGSTSYRKIGIRVYHGPDGFDSEITSSSPVAIATYVSTGLHSATWDCPQHALAATDKIGVVAYIGDGTNWGATASWFLTSTALGASQLDSATWTVYYYLTVISNRLRFYYGHSTYNSRVTNFQWTPGANNYVADLSKTLTSSWTIATKTDYRIAPSESLTTSWLYDTRTTYQIDFSQTFTTSWLVDVLWTQAAQQYFADLSQNLATTWEILTQSTFQTDFTQALSTTWEVLTKTDYGISLDLSSVTSWIVDVSQGIGYTVDLSLTIATSWIVDVVFGLADVGFPILLPFLIIAAMIILCMSIYVRKQQRQNK